MHLNVVQTGTHAAVANVPHSTSTSVVSWPLDEIAAVLRKQYGLVVKHLKVKTALRGFGGDKLFLSW